MRLLHGRLPWLISALFTSGAAIAACSAEGTAGHGGLGGGGGNPFGTGGAGTGAHHQGTGGSNIGGGLVVPDGGKDAEADVKVNPCGTQCGPKELCDADHLGLDDNCDGNVDEGCSCSPGQAHFCFKGDASYRNTPGCFDGTERCTENGTWGPCVGGKHATPEDKCYAASLVGCHSISATPFSNVDLKTGTGDFSDDADSGSETWSVTCPAGVSPCPTPMGTPAEQYTPVQSGEYPIVYTKKVHGAAKSCNYSLFVGAPGLRVELTWEHQTTNGGADLDLHMHQPMDTTDWNIYGEEQDCGFADCTAGNFAQAASPHWFDDDAGVPDPVNWDNDPDPSKNTCYNAPHGNGAIWAGLMMGCHNPRLDVDDVVCNPSVTDPSKQQFCAPENINLDYPPSSEWIRVGVHYYWNHSISYSVHPEVKVYCDSKLAADLGPLGYASPVTFTPSQGSKEGSGNVFWVVGDILYKPASMCVPSQCIVQPVFLDASAMTADVESDNGGTPLFGPAYPAVPPP